ncbi:MAG: hypothetical protein EOO06_09590 [Chitinophagaceae bacterium]|nr:MAG: hypothetical protein EOO06_09590 [Chitinophagaceae bacterium]
MGKLTLIYKYLFYITLLAELFPLIFCILFYKKLNTKALKVFFAYAVSLFSFTLLAFLSREVAQNSMSYFLLLRIFNIVEYTLIALFLRNVYQSTLFRRIVIFTIVPFIIFAVVDYIVTDKSQFNNHSTIVSSLLLILFIIYFFFEKMNTVVIYPLYQSISFWICVGLFLYFSGSFFFFLFIKAGEEKEFVILMNSIYAFVVILKNGLLSGALLASENSDSNDSLQIPNDLDLDELSPLIHPKKL